MTSDDQDTNTQLQTAFDFNDEDLQANRRGTMTAAQQQRLNSNLGYWKKAGLTVLVVLISTVLGAFTVSANPDPTVGIEYVPAASLVIAVATVIFLIWLYFHERQSRADASNGTVVPIRGHVRIKKNDHGVITSIRIDGQTLWFSPQQKTLIDSIRDARPDVTLTAYCTPTNHKVLSVELA